MRLPGAAPSPAVRPPGGLRLDEWGKADPARFYAVYAAAFGDRPGFPGWPLARWAGWISDDEDFRADWTLLGTAGGEDVAFIAGAASGWMRGTWIWSRAGPSAASRAGMVRAGVIVAVTA